MNPNLLQVRLGLLTAFSASLVLAFFNICIRVLIQRREPQRILGGWLEIQGMIIPNFGNSLLILFLRLLVVILVMPILATFLYPGTWDDLKRFLAQRDRRLWLTVISSAFCLFLSQIFIYISWGNITPGIAITLFFIYPLITILGAWILFGNRPSFIGGVGLGGVMLGLLITGSPSFGVSPYGNPGIGVLTALGAGFTFAGYVLLTQMAAGKLHPVPFSLIHFFGLFVLASVSLILVGAGLPLPPSWQISLESSAREGFILGCSILGILTLFSYLLNNCAIRLAGAALSAIVGTLGPGLTGILALLILGENLRETQWLGLSVVTISVAIIS